MRAVATKIKGQWGIAGWHTDRFSSLAIPDDYNFAPLPGVETRVVEDLAEAWRIGFWDSKKTIKGGADNGF